MQTLKELVREAFKMVTVLSMWVFPVWLSVYNNNYTFMWFLLVSSVMTIGIYSHYERLNKIDGIVSMKDAIIEQKQIDEALEDE